MKLRYLILLVLSVNIVFFSCDKPEEPKEPGISIEDFWDDEDEDNKDDDFGEDDFVVDEPSDDDNSNIPAGFKDEKNDTAKDKAGSFDYSKLAKAGHPRLLMSEKDFEDLKVRLGKDKANNKVLLMIHRIIIAKAEEYAARTTAMKDPSNHEDNVSELLTLAYAYRLTGSSKYFTRLNDDVNNILKWSKISGGELGTGEHSLAIAIVYDWLYYDLTYDQRVGLRKFLVNKAIVPSMSFDFRKFWGNWNQVGNGGVMCAALATYEKNKLAAYDAIEAGVVDNKTTLQKILVGGGYPEGIGYWAYGMTYQVALFQSLLNIFGHTAGLTDVSGVMDSGMYGLMMHGTIYTSFAYNDGGTTGDNNLIPAWWYAAQKKDADLVYGELYLLNTERYSTHYSRFTALIPALLKSFNPDQILTKKPSDKVWSCKGEMPLCIVRRGWNYDKTDYYLGIKGGYADTWQTMKTAHGHMDAGSFVFEAEGVRWSDDVTRPGYSSWNSKLEAAGGASSQTDQRDIKWGTFNIHALCHSTLVSYTNDGSIIKLHSTDHYVDGKATLSKVINNTTGQGAELDMSAPLKGQVKSATRTVLLLPDGTLQVTDKITALDSKDSVVEWRMISQATAEKSSSGIKLTSVKDSSKKRQLTASCDNSSVSIAYNIYDPVIPSDWTGFTYIQTISDKKIASWKATVPKGKTVTFTTKLKKL